MYALKLAGSVLFLSTLSLRRATLIALFDFPIVPVISIHALLAESDMIRPRSCNVKPNFYPRSPCGERPGSGHTSQQNAIYFYPRSPCGERPRTGLTYGGGQNISIHALLAESDEPTTSRNNKNNVFLSTLSLRRATALLNAQNRHLAFLSTLSLRRATMYHTIDRERACISIHALLAESDFPT